MASRYCGGCSKSITAECTTALGKQWHPSCFVCAVCKAPLGGGSFFHDKGRPYCQQHFHAQQGSLCGTCQEPISGRCINAAGKRFHPEHFVCAFCRAELAQGTFKESGGKPYCAGCHRKLFG
jgi:uncharacterized CHY-type Zn-finger protein